MSKTTDILNYFADHRQAKLSELYAAFPGTKPYTIRSVCNLAVKAGRLKRAGVGLYESAVEGEWR